ncbi:MAG TPA: hypothetical protein VG939_07180 [Caulobacteraceae bacterium]|nr:hypothetical protein [Caulobacteraceae bacterium]
MRVQRPAPAGLAVLLAGVLAAGAAEAKVRMFAYDPANDETRHVAGPLTFEFRQKLVFNTILAIRATEAKATANLKPVDESTLGKGGLDPLIGANAPERDLYEIEPGDEGDAMVAAFCPGSKKGWASFGRLRANRDLRVRILGDKPGGGVRLCHTLDFIYHGEWKAYEPTTVNPREVKVPHFPYGG